MLLDIAGLRLDIPRTHSSSCRSENTARHLRSRVYLSYANIWLACVLTFGETASFFLKQSSECEAVALVTMEPTTNIYHDLTFQKCYLMTFCAGFSNFGYQILRGFWYLFLIGTIPKLILRHLWTVSASFFEALSLKTEIS